MDTASAQASGGPERTLRAGGYRIATAAPGEAGLASVERLPETAARPRAAGATDFCTKPVEPRRLLAAVRRLCPVD